MILRFSSGSVTPSSRSRKFVGGIDIDQRHAEMAREDLLHQLGFAQAQQSVVHEDRGELIADRLVDQRRRHRRIDPAAECEQHPLVADLRADLLHGAVDERIAAPVERQPADVGQEVPDDLLPLRGVHHLGVELDARRHCPLIMAAKGSCRFRR